MMVPKDFIFKIPGTGLDMTSSEFNRKHPPELKEQQNIFDILNAFDDIDASGGTDGFDEKEDTEDLEL